MRQWKRIHRTEIIRNESNPQFKPFVTTSEADLHENNLTTIRISCYDWDLNNPKGELVGCVQYMYVCVCVFVCVCIHMYMCIIYKRQARQEARTRRRIKTRKKINVRMSV